MTVDGVGEWPTTTYSSGSGAEIKRLGSVEFPDSLGLFYSAVTGYLGFEVNEGEYKVMGLAPYGRPTYIKQIREIIENGPRGEFRLNLRYYAFLQTDRMFSDDLPELLGNPPRSPESEITQFHMDVACSAQVVLEEVLLSKVRYLHSIFPSENLCMAGGVALNVVANSRCLSEGPFKRMFVQPAAGDAGGCLGAAAVAHVSPVWVSAHASNDWSTSISVRRTPWTRPGVFCVRPASRFEITARTKQGLSKRQWIGWSRGRSWPGFLDAWSSGRALSEQGRSLPIRGARKCGTESTLWSSRGRVFARLHPLCWRNSRQNILL